jgi:hypothetical protein
MRRSIIAASAALAVGGSLALAASASAIPVPIGSPSDTAYSGSGTPTSVYSLYNAASNGLLLAENLIHATGIDTTNFSTAFTSASQLNSTNVAEIASDFSVTASSNANNFYALDIAWCETPSTSGGAGQSMAVCTNGGTPPAVPPAMVTSEFTGTVQPEVASAAANWPQLSQLVGFLGSASGTLNSADAATVSSSGTVTSTTTPVAYDVKLSAPSGGYIVPSAFSLTFPAGLSVNTGLVSDEVNAAANGTSASAIAAIEANPSGTSIGTVTLTSPLADEFGGSNGQFVGKIYVVQTGASGGQGSVTQPYLELWFTQGIYELGAFPGSLSFPLTLGFGEATVAGLGQEPLPISSLELNFPAATSPVKTTSCTTLGTAGGAATDEIAGLAYEFGDKSDGVSSATGTPSSVTLGASVTAVTDNCVATKKVKSTATGSASGLTTGHPTFTLRIKTAKAFGTVTVGLPGGLKFVKSKRLAKEVSTSGASIRSVRIAGGRLVITLKSKVKSITIKTKRGAVSETAALIKSIKKHKTKKLTLRIKAGTTSLKATIKA